MVQDMKKPKTVDVFLTAVFTARTGLQASQSPETRGISGARKFTLGAQVSGRGTFKQNGHTYVYGNRGGAPVSVESAELAHVTARSLSITF